MRHLLQYFPPKLSITLMINVLSSSSESDGFRSSIDNNDGFFYTLHKYSAV